MSRAAPIPEPADEELAGRIARRDESPAALERARQAGQELYQRHARPLLAFLAGRAARADLEDIHQAVWLRVWQALPGHFAGGHFRGWLFQIARNLLVDWSRRRRPEPLGDEAERLAAADGSPDAALLADERRQALQKCLQGLTAAEAAVVQGRIGGEGYPELCRRLGLSANQAYKLFFEAKGKLERCVERAGQ